MIDHIVDLEFEECTEEMCENIAEIKFDNFCRGIADSALMDIAMEEIAAYTNSIDCIGFYEECLVTKENNMCEKGFDINPINFMFNIIIIIIIILAADLIFKAVFDVELYMQSKELFKRMADVQICEKAAERFIKERIKKEIEFDRQEMLKRTEFFANQTVNTILAKNLDGIVGELIGITNIIIIKLNNNYVFVIGLEIDHYLLIMNDIVARNKYEIQITEESIDESFNNILHAEIKACLVELAEFQKELEFQVLLRKNENIVDIIMDTVFNEEIEDAVTKVDDGMYEDLEDFLELQESAATSRKIERRLKVLIFILIANF